MFAFIHRSTHPAAGSILRDAGLVFLSAILLSFVSRAQSLSDRQTTPTQLTGHEDHHITLHDAARLTRNYRTSVQDEKSATLGEFFSRDALVAALDQKNCIGLRIYYGKRDDGMPVLVFVGVDAAGNDMTDGFVGEYGYLCPPICGAENQLTLDDAPLAGLSALTGPAGPK